MSQMFLPVSTRHKARIAAPWAAVIAKVEGGFIAFATVTGYRIWKGTL